MRFKTGHDPVENARQEKMTFVDTEKYIKDGVEYTVHHLPSGLSSCEAPEIPVPHPGVKGWVSYKFSYAFSKPNDMKIRTIKISPHSKAGKALVKS